MRIRSIKPEWLEDEGLLRAGLAARVLSVSLILLADDYGRGRLIERVLEAQCFPFEAESSRVFREALARLSEMGFVTLYKVRGQRYFEIPNWSKHQKVDKPGKPHVPEPIDDSRESYRVSREILETDRDQDHDLDLRTGTTRARRPDFNSKDLELIFSELRQAAGGGSFRAQRSDYDRSQTAVAWAIEQSPTNPAEAVRASIGKFLKHANSGNEAGWPFWAWANDPGRWLAYSQNASAVSGQRRQRVGPIASDQQIADGARKNPDWMNAEQLEVAK